MLNFRNTNIVFGGLFLLGLGFSFYYPLPWYVYLLFLIIYSLLLFYGSYYVGSQFFMKVLCAANTQQKQIALSFDDGPANAYSGEILRILRDKKIEATFFCIGKQVITAPEIVQQITSEGHIIGNHSFSHHFWFDMFGTKKMLADIQQMSIETKKISGYYPLLFRPPYGVTTPNMRKAMDRGNFTAIGWSIRSLDTVIKSEEKLLKKITSSLQPGAVILLHDTSASCLAVLPKLIDEARQQGYEFIRLDKLLNVKPYA